MNSTTYETIRKTTVTRGKTAATKTPTIAQKATIETIGDQDVVLFDGIAPRRLVAQFEALIAHHNATDC